MKFLDKMERKYEKFAIKNLMLYIVIANAITYAFALSSYGSRLISNLILDPALVMQGQVWRLVTFLFLPPTYNIIFIFFSLYFYYIIGLALEATWGRFKFNLYYFTTTLCIIIGSFITGYPATNEYLNLSLFLVFAHLFPNMEVNLYFLLPIKVKHLAYIYWIIIGISLFDAPTLPQKLAILFPYLGFFLFFGKDIFLTIIGKKKRRNIRIPSHKNGQKQNNSKIKVLDNYTIHKCTVCGITEKDDSNMEFRFCSQCHGFHEYCMTHLKNHEHIKEEE